jgi:hypothetical protein
LTYFKEIFVTDKKSSIAEGMENVSESLERAILVLQELGHSWEKTSTGILAE